MSTAYLALQYFETKEQDHHESTTIYDRNPLVPFEQKVISKGQVDNNRHSSSLV